MKRILSGWLALCLILSMLPVQVFAQSEVQEEIAVEAVEEIAQEELPEEIVEESPEEETAEPAVVIGEIGGTDQVSYTSTVDGNVAVNKTNFPDDNFREFILEQDYGADGVLTAEELADVEEIGVSGTGIVDLTGIEYFYALECLYCTDNHMSELDLSGNTALKGLLCSDNNLTALDLSNNTNLESLGCSDNKLTALDLSNNIELESLECDNNNLTELDMSNNTALSWVTCCYNGLTALDLSNNVKLEYLDCSNNKLTALDLSKNTKLEYLNCNNNKLTALNLRGDTKLNCLDCSNNNLTTLNLSENTKLNYLDCNSNNLTALDLDRNTNLESLFCSSNSLTALDLGKSTYLESLSCSSNKLTTLNLSKNTELESLNCGSNKLTALDLSKNTRLESLDCSGNQLVCLDLSKNTRCRYVYAYDNCRQIAVDEKNQFDLSNLPGFNVSKASNWSGGKVSKNILTVRDTSITYCYQVSGDDTVYFTLKAKNFHYLSPLMKVKADSKTGGGILSWEGYGASYYQIYQATSSKGQYSLQGTVWDTKAKVSVPAGKTYYFKVKAFYGYGEDRICKTSSAVKVTGKCAAPVVTAKNVASTGKIKLSWKKIEGAKEYKIYRASSKSGEYKLLKTTTSTSYTTGGTVGKTYYYKVKAIHKNSGANSAYSAAVSCVRDLERPDVSIKLKSGDPKLSWDKVSGASEYYVYRSTSKDGSYKKVKSTTKLTWTDTGVKAGKTYYYKVKAIHKNTSANSAYSSVDKIKAK